MFAPKSNTQSPKPNNSIFGSSNTDFIQPKLNVGKSGDQYEVEADKAADQIVAKSKEPSSTFVAPSPTIQKQTEEDVQKQESENEIQQKPVVDKITHGVQLKLDPVLQKQPEEEVQTKEDEEIQEKEEEEVVQKQATSDGGDGSGIESSLSASKGGGSSLESGVQSEMESGFGSDFSNVRVHNDSSAVQMNQELGSQAFANGNDIYFNEGKYNPSSDSGKHLLAHELTHTVQQGASPSVQSKMIQKASKTNTTTPQVPLKGNNYDISGSIPKLYLDNVPIPAFKHALLKGSNHFRAREYSFGGRKGKNDAGQQEVWNKISHKGAHRKLLNAGLRDDRFYYMRGAGKGDKGKRYGNAELIAQHIKVPLWDKAEGAKEEYEIDHKQELQYSGWPRVKTAGGIDNLQLLSKGANNKSGGLIKSNINTAIVNLVNTEQDVKKAVESVGFKTNKVNHKFADRLKRRFDIHYRSFTPSGNPPGIKTWDKNQIEKGHHANALVYRKQRGRGAISLFDTEDPSPNLGTPFDKHTNLNIENLIGSSSNYLLYWGSNKNYKQKLSWKNEDSLTQGYNGNGPFIKQKQNFFDTSEIKFDPNEAKNQIGYIRGRPFKKKGKKNNTKIIKLPEFYSWPIYRMPGTRYAGYVQNSDLKNFINNSNPDFALLSPFSLNSLQIGSLGIQARGQVLPSVPFISKANVEIVLTDDDVRLQKTFNSSDFNMPGPFKINDTSMTLGYGLNNGMFIEGRVDFGIDSVGEGFVGASASTGSGFALEGEFNFDSKLFDPAKISVEYKENIWTIGGEIGIPEGKVKGVKNANITASYSEGLFKADGNAELDIPGIDKGSMSVEYGPKGFSMGGNFQLSKDIPGIKGGSVEAKVSKKEGEEDYSVFVSGTAQPDIPGINSSLTVTYDNGALTIEGKASYSRGMLSGEITLGATNRGLDDEGKPSGEIDDTMRVYGGGSLTLQLTPWLAATAAVKFLPNGEMEVTARLDAASYDVFKRKEVKKNLFSVPTIEIPLFAIPLGPKSIGLVAQIGGGLDFKAGFGPGQLRNLSAEITYNPDREEETTVKGHGEFAIPADAGLTLRGDLSIGVSIAIASITGGIELAGTLGLAGEALASVDLNWSPQTGLEINAMGSILVSPKFTFDINAFIRGTLGIGWFSVSETWRKNLLSYEWGPGIEFGIKFPVNYKEGEPFDMSFDDIEVVYPELDIPKMAKGVATDAKDQII